MGDDGDWIARGYGERQLGMRRLDEDALVVSHLIAMGEAGMASGIDAVFDIDNFVLHPAMDLERHLPR